MVYGSAYGVNRTGVSINPDYTNSFGVWNAIEESIENEQKLFDIVIEKDFLEAAAYVNESAAMELQAVNEGFASSVWETVLKALRKVKEFIKSIIAAAKVRLGAFFKKDTAALIDKYEDQFNAADGDLKIKGFRACKFSGSYKRKCIDTAIQKSTELWNKICITGKKKDVYSKDADVDLEDFFGTGLSSKAAITKELMDDNFDPASTESLSSISTQIIKVLTDHSTWETALDKEQSDFESTVSDYEKDAQSWKSTAEKMDAGDDRDNESARASAAHTLISKFNKVIGVGVGALTDIIKFDVKQCRKAFIKAATSGARSAVKNESALLEAILDADDYEVDSFFEQYDIDDDEY